MKHRLGRYTIGFLVLMASVTVGQVTPTAPPPKVDLLETARGQVQRHELQSAVATLNGYLRQKVGGSIGDAHVDDAVKLLQTAATSLSKELESKQPVDAAHVLITAAAVPAMAAQRDALEAPAKTLLKKAYDTGVQKKDPALVVSALDQFAAAFPNDPPMADAPTALSYRLKVLGQVKKTARPEVLLLQVRALKTQGATEDDLKPLDLNETQLVIRLAQKTYDRGWYREAVALIREELAAQHPRTPDLTRQLNVLLEKAILGHVTACAQLGNGPMLNDALALYAIPENVSGDAGKVARYKTAAAKMQTTPMPLTFSAPIQGEGQWIDDGGGFKGDAEVKIGQPGPRSQNPPSGKVTVQPGFVLDGGTIHCIRGQLKFAGTPDKPILLRNVEIQCDYVGAISASYTIFQNCTFRKSGGTYWVGGWSSKWELDDCLFISSRFRSLSQTDYGIKLQRCTFVDCFIPDRNVNEDPAKDGGAQYRHTWNKISEATFYNCRFRPSLVWSTQGSVFYDCDVHEPSMFASTKNFDVPLAACSDDPKFVQSLIENTELGGVGGVGYPVTLVDKLQPRPSPLWKLAPERPGPPGDPGETEEAPKGKAE